MTAVTNRRRRWPFFLAAIAILAVTVIYFPPMSKTERQMLGTWQQEGIPKQYTFEAGHRMTRRFEGSPTQFGRWAASDGVMTEFEFDSNTVTAVESMWRRIVRFWTRRSTPPTTWLVQVDESRMLWRLNERDNVPIVFTRVE